MIIGNRQGQGALQIFFQHIKKNKRISFPFLLVSGVNHIGKTTCIENFLKELLGDCLMVDYKALYDFSEQFKKKHSLKVSTSSKEGFLEIEGKIYENIGAREIIQRFSMAPLGNYKVLLIENIERMTISAANAFLKTLEEPLPGRLIIATTSNKERLLDTILSRALIITFHIPLMSEVQKYLKQRYTDIPLEERSFAAYFSLGRLGLAKSLLDKGENISEKAILFQELLDIYGGNKNDRKYIIKKYTLWKSFYEKGLLEEALDAVMFSLSSMGHIDKVGQILNFRNFFRSNVGKDNIIFGMSL